MPENANQTEMERRNALRLSDEESNRLTGACIEAALILLMEEEEFDSLGDDHSSADLFATYKPHKLKRHDAAPSGADVVVFPVHMNSVAALAVLAAVNLFSRKDDRNCIRKEGGTTEMLCRLSTIEVFSYPALPYPAGFLFCTKRRPYTDDMGVISPYL